MRNREYEQLAEDTRRFLPDGPTVAVLGSSAFWHDDSEETCLQIGEALADLPDLVLLTGGVSGIGEGVGRSFYNRRLQLSVPDRVFHILPRKYAKWDYGGSLVTGDDMLERREVLARLCRTYVTIEGGPGTEHECRVALANRALIIPVGRSGGYSAILHSQLSRPTLIPEPDWKRLAAADSTPRQIAVSVRKAVEAAQRL